MEQTMKINLNQLFEFAGASELIVGRNNSEIPAIHPTVSKRHAVIKKSQDNEFIISDLESLNGVKVNGVLVKSARLQSGDVVTLGDLSFTVLCEDKEKAKEKKLELVRSTQEWISSSSEIKKYLGW